MLQGDFLSEEEYKRTTLSSARDVWLFTLDMAAAGLAKAIGNLREGEYHWEPLSDAEREQDMPRPPDEKRVWRVFQQPDGQWTYDYGREREPSPFTTIAWLVNHVASTADMYLYCIRAGKAAGEEKSWDDIVVPPTLPQMMEYTRQVFGDARRYLVSVPGDGFVLEINRPTPAPWGERRPTFMNLWGGLIGHTLQHTAQIAARKEWVRTRDRF